MTQTVLLAGATGMLGSQIAHRLLARPDARIRLMVRNRRNASGHVAMASFLERGAEIVEGDLARMDSLDRATQNVDVIVSAVQGGPDVLIDGQVALAEAGKRNGVRRILPSDFALDLFRATPGEHPLFDMRAKADAGIAETGLEQVNMLQGAFMNMFLPGRGAVDVDNGTVSFYGNGDRQIEVTSVDDTARMVASVALDPDVPAGKFAFAGDRISFRQAGSIIAARTGRSLRPVSLGSEADLRAAMTTADPQKKVMLAYLLYMTNGQTALTNLRNDRYPNVRFESFTSFVARSLPVAAGA